MDHKPSGGGMGLGLDPRAAHYMEKHRVGKVRAPTFVITPCWTTKPEHQRPSSRRRRINSSTFRKLAKIKSGLLFCVGLL